MKILLTNLEVTTLITNYKSLEDADIVLQEEFSVAISEEQAKKRKETSLKIMTFLVTPDSEYKDGPMTLSKVKNGVGIEIEEAYIVEFLDIYLASIVPMLRPMREIAKASKVMATNLKALEAKFEIKN